jgi:surface antigen
MSLIAAFDGGKMRDSNARDGWGYMSRISLYSSIIVVALFASVLSSSADGNALGLKPAPLPKYQPGNTYVYANGTWETAIDVSAEGITWRNHRGWLSTGSADFTYKRFKWETTNRYGYRQFNQTRFLMTPPTSSLWPLQVGNRTRFDELGRWFDPQLIEHRYDSFWSCEVLGTEQVSIAAGDFDTWKITCKRYPDKFRAASKTREYRTWYYAPALNHWVIEERDYNGYRENRRKELIAVLPDLQTFSSDENDIAAVQKQFQNALEFSPSGEASVWENLDQQLVIGVTPLQTFKHSSGHICRQYRQVLAKEGLAYEYPGIACRSGGGRWSVPRR